MDYASPRSHGCRITEYFHRGFKHLLMENEQLALRIIPDKGAEIVELRYKPMDLDFMWHSPNALREPGKQVPTVASKLGSYCDHLQGGWQEILPGGGPDSYKGAELGLHGEVAMLPWDCRVEEDEPGRISVLFSCRTIRLPFLIKKRISLSAGSTVVEFEEWLTNQSGEDLEFLWAQHPIFGAPFLGAGCRIDIPAREFATSDFYNSPTALFKPEHVGKWPVSVGLSGDAVDLSVIPPAGKPVSDIYFLKGLEEGWYAITNPELGIGFGLSWDLSVFPYMTCWQVCGGGSGYPWYGQAYCMSLEIWNSFTDKLRTVQTNGTLRSIRGNETVHTKFKAVVFQGRDRVKRITQDGAVERRS